MLSLQKSLMKTQSTEYNIHPSIRGWFAYHLYCLMNEDDRIVLLTGDLGYKMFDTHRSKYPDRFYNCGASEQAMVDIAIGLALNGKTPIVYSITPFLVLRTYESIVGYINREKIPVKLVGSGNYDDYNEDGASHWFYSHESIPIPIIEFNHIKEIKRKTRINRALTNKKPYLILLRR